jgi:hypothetical protein
LWEQCELARAQAAGTTFAPVKFRSVVEHDTGIRRQVETPKRVKPWWFTTESGKLALSVRYGTRVLELAKGKIAVEVGAEKDLVPTLELIKTAVLNGELDTQIEAAANKPKLFSLLNAFSNLSKHVSCKHLMLNIFNIKSIFINKINDIYPKLAPLF